MSLLLFDALFVRPLLCLSGVAFVMWLHRILPLVSTRCLLALGIMMGITDLVGQLVDFEILVMPAEARSQLYYAWGWLAVIALPFWISCYRSLARRVRSPTTTPGV
jgi:hypothetical protein